MNHTITLFVLEVKDARVIHDALLVFAMRSWIVAVAIASNCGVHPMQLVQCLRQYIEMVYMILQCTGR